MGIEILIESIQFHIAPPPQIEPLSCHSELRKDHNNTKSKNVVQQFNTVTQWKMDGNKRNLNKRTSHGHFKYIKKHENIPRNCCFIVITLCSPNFFYFFL